MDHEPADDTSAKNANDSREMAKNKKTPLLSKVLLGLGAFSTYNMVTHYQTLLDTSESVHWIARWWRYFVSLPFHWIHLEIPQVQRETIAILLFITGAANFAVYKWRQISPVIHWKKMFAFSWDSSAYITDSDLKNAGPFAYIILMSVYGGTFSAFLLSTRRNSWETIIIISVSFVLWISSIIEKFVVKKEYFRGRNIRRLLWMFTIPYKLFVAWIVTIAVLWKDIMKSGGIIILIILLDVLFKYSVDPILRTHPRLPDPPTMVSSSSDQ